MDTTDIEKKSLEAHVELCAERYRMLELKIETVESSIESVKVMVESVHEMVHTMSAKRNDHLSGWGIAILGFLVATVGWMLANYVFK